MPSAVQWDAAFVDRGTVLTTELNALANNARSNGGTEYDNSTGLNQYALLELQVTFGSAPSAGGYVEVQMIQAPNGTNYQDGSSSVDPGAHTLVAVIPVNAVTSAQRICSRMFQLPPSKVKFLITDRSGQAFPATGSTLRLFTANDEIQ